MRKKIAFMNLDICIDSKKLGDHVVDHYCDKTKFWLKNDSSASFIPKKVPLTKTIF